MALDEQLYHQVKALDRPGPCYRFYTWETPSLTVSYNKTIPDDLHQSALGGAFDVSPRMTGGGIVFHCPGDIVFFVAGSQAQFGESKIKQMMQRLSGDIAHAIQKTGRVLEMSESEVVSGMAGPRQIQFCNGYFNPYEWYFQGEKAVAIAARRIRDMFVFQGIIHTQESANFFSMVPDTYQRHFTKGLPGLTLDEFKEIWG